MGKKILGTVLFSLMTVLLVVGCGTRQAGTPENAGARQTTATNLTITVLNVGQGDAVLVDSGAQKVLIDTGDADERDKLDKELKKQRVTELDKVILSHPHADHIGGMALLLRDYKVKEVYDNGMPSTSPIYRAYMKEMKTQNIPRQGLKAGDKVDLGNGVKFVVFSPRQEVVTAGQAKGYKHNPNNESVVGKLTFGEFGMLFTGDAEKEIEAELVEAYGTQLRSQVLKCPHHGSKTSSGQKFIETVQPKEVVISLGENNEYGHPHGSTLERYERANVKVYRTDKDGTVQILTDGKKYEIKTGEGN